MSLALFLHAPSRFDVTGIHSPALESLIYVFLLLATILLVRLMDRVMWSGYREWRLQATMLERANRELAITIDSMQVQSASLAKANRDLQSEIVERRQAQQLLRAVVAGTAAVTGADFMRSLVKYLAEALAVPYVFVGEALDLDPCRVRALAFWNDGMPGPLFEYCVPGTPCQEVVSRGETLYIPEGVRELYPDDMDLVEMRCDGYFGTPLVTMSGGIIGNLVLMDRIPLRLDEQKQSLVKVFAARASAELERQHAEAALELERSLLAQRVDERTAELRMLNTELSRVSQRKDEFLASMSHDLRTPLNSVIGMAESLQDGVYGPLGERQVKAAKVIEASGRHLLELINDVLDVSKIEAGQMILAMGAVDVDALCRACLAFVGAAAQHKRITIDYTCGPDVPELVADERRLKQVLINLLSNAVKFTDDGGQVGLRVQFLPADDSIEFVVWDTGIGIDPQQIDRLFRPFVQIETGLNRKQGGTGLGLSIVKRLVEMHGGTVTVESQVNAGSRFIVVLPNGANGNNPAASPVISLPPAASE
ncbi:MAG: hypothetical protein IPK16_19000 [Anaerolineales bacterium]|nr:hypothetical protein [Anaerolineales bacterium]